MSFLKAFSTLLLKFNDELIELFPEETEFNTLKTAIELVKKTNPRLMVEIFRSYIDLWKTQILSRDESFFMANDYDEITQGDDYFKTLIERLKKHWDTLSENNKNSIWKYLETLIKIAEKC
jgi:hypothetical protein